MCLARFFKRKCIRLYGSCNRCRSCPDMFVGLINLNQNSFHTILVPYGKLQKCDLPLIVMVLESPHKSEYSIDGFPIGPARGRTGDNIKLYLKNHLKNNNFFPGCYKLLLVEAISYQCSNGNSLYNNKKNQKRRDDMFKMMWLCGGMKYFEKRMRLYKPNVVINSCTGGFGESSSGSNQTLKSLVQKSIDRVCLKSKMFCSSHPSSRWFKENGNLKEITL